MVSSKWTRNSTYEKQMIEKWDLNNIFFMHNFIIIKYWYTRNEEYEQFKQKNITNKIEEHNVKTPYR